MTWSLHQEATLRGKYKTLEPLYNRLCEEVKFALCKALENIRTQEIEARVKSFESASEKLQRKEAGEFGDLVDLAGVRVVCLLISDMPRIGAVIRTIFEVISVDDKTQRADDSFGYMSVHYIARLGNTYSGARYADLHEVRFEIQVRTLAMHAWAGMSHYLSYQSEESVPPNLRRSLNALSALFYIADQQFEAFYKSSESSRQNAERLTLETLSNEDIQIDLDVMAAYLQKKFPHRKHSETNELTKLIVELRAAGIHTIDQLDAELTRATAAVVEYEKYAKNSPAGLRLNLGADWKYADVGFVRIALTLTSNEYLRAREMLGVSKETITSLVDETRPFRRLVQPKA